MKMHPTREVAILEFAKAEQGGYCVHQGTQADGELDRLFWWTLMREGWMEPEVSQGEWATAEEARTDAVANFRNPHISQPT